MTNKLMTEALKYANEFKWYVFPCREKEREYFIESKGKRKVLPVKSPYYKGGFQLATLDNNKIKEWWSIHPEAAIGISCGHSNLIVVDIDTHSGDRRGFDNFMSLNISDEGAFHSLTPTGGIHIVYKGLSNSYGDKERAVDVRSHGAYFIAPPSFIYVDGIRKSYSMLDEWSGEPIEAPKDLMEKLNVLRSKNKSEKKRKTIVNESFDNQAIRVKKALEKLPQEYCDEYFKWVNVGLILKSLGNTGFQLWDEWSRKSSKYDAEELEYRWERFEPREIGLGSLFFWAYGNRKHE